MQFNCKQCNISFNKKPSRIKNHNFTFCSPECKTNFYNIEVQCTNCNKLFIKHKSEISENNFCNRSCSAIYNNSKRQKLEKLSNKVNDKIILNELNKLKQLDIIKSKTLLEVGTNNTRYYNRIWNSCKQELPCHICGYDKFVELHHIKPISSFIKSTPIGEINSPNNVIQLCPNCHWEAHNIGTTA